MKINWKVRIKNKQFWYALIPALAILVSAICNVFDIVIDLSMISEKLLYVIESLFIVLAILGIVNDPTTEGYNDSERALEYDEPYKEESQGD